MGGRRRCCCGGCVAITDSFVRTELGNAWEAVDGSWSISSGRLVESGTNPSLIYHSHGIKQSLGMKSGSQVGYYMTVGARIYNETSGSVFSVYGRYADADNYIEGRYTRVDYDYATLAIYKKVGGVEQLLSSLTHELADKDTTERQIKLCLNEAVMLFDTSDESNCFTAADPVHITNGNKGGLGHQNANQTAFDDFFLYQLYDGETLCYSCGVCYCDNRTLSYELYATYLGDPDTDCDTLDGITVKLSIDPCAQPPLLWRGVINDGCLAGSGAEMELACVEGEDSPAVGWQLTIIGGTGPVCMPLPLAPGQRITLSSIEGSTCDPFSLIFAVSIENSSGVDQLCPGDCRPCGDPGGAMEPKPMRYRIYVTE